MHKQNGFTLLEVLIALVVLSVGMLGIAALNVEGMRTGGSANMRTKAMTLVTDMAERMRANRVGALAGDYVVNANEVGLNRDCADDQIGAVTVVCTPDQMADHDIWLWKRKLANPQVGLPAAEGQVMTDGNVPPTFTIDVQWTANGETENVSLSLQL